MNNLSKFLLLTILYFVSGKLGLLMAVPPGYATAVWPPSGFAFAGLLAFGNRFWWSIWLGSFLVNLGTSLDTSTLEATLVTAGPPFIIGFGAAMQACVGATLVRKFLGYPTALVQESKVVKFLLLAGPLSCLINPTVGIATLLLSGAIQWSSAAFSWWTWWVGDSIGVLIFGPIFMAFIGQPKDAWKSRRVTVALPMMVTFVGMVLLFGIMQQTEEKRIAEDIKARSILMMTAIEHELDRHLDVLYAVRSFYQSSNEVERSEFANFVANSLERYAGITAVEWDAKVPHDQRKAYEESFRREGFSDFVIQEMNAQMQIQPSGIRDVYFPITFAEPFNETNRKVLGFDFMSEKSRQNALESAWRSGQLALTKPVQLIQGSKGIIAFLGIYDNQQANKTDEERMKGLKGFVVEILKIDDVVLSALKQFPDRNFVVHIVDLDEGGHTVNVFNLALGPGHTVIEDLAAVKKVARGLYWETIKDFGGRQWRVSIYPTADYFIAGQSWNMWMILAGGLLLISLLGGFLIILSGRETLVRRLVDDGTRELHQVNLRLKEGLAEQAILSKAMTAKNLELDEARRIALNIAQDAQEAQLKASEAEARFRMIVEGVKDYAIFLLDVKGYVVTWNLGAERFKKYTAQEIIGKHFSLFYPTSDIESGKPSQILDIAHKEGVYEEVGLRVRKDGTTFWARVLITALKDHQGMLRGYSEISLDVTEQRLNEEKVLQFSRAVEASPVSIVITDTQGNMEYVNPRFVEVTGYSLAEVLGKNTNILKSGEQSREFYKNLWETIMGKGIWRGELHNKKKGGELFWESVSISPILNSVGEITHFVAVKEDITDLKRTRDEIRLLNLYQKALLDNAGYSIISTDINGVIKVFNPSAEKMLGYQAQEVVGKYTPEIIHDKNEVIERAKEFSREFNEKIQPGFEVFVFKARKNLPSVHEWTYVRKDGTRFPVLLSVTALRDGAGEISGFLGIATDITERRKSEDQIRESEEKFRSAVQYSAIGMALVSVDGHWLQINPALSKILGYSAEELLKSDFQSLTHPDDLAGDLKLVDKVLSGEINYYHIEKRYLHKQGHVVWGLLSVSIVRDTDGKSKYFVSQIQDITESKIAEQKLKEMFYELGESHKRLEGANQELTSLNAELKRMSNLKSEFTSMVSHELRTPLTVIKESVGIVYDETAGPVNADQKDFLETAKRNVDRLARLINDVLDYQKLESQHVEFRMIEQDMNDLLREVGKGFQLSLKNKGLDLVLQLQTGLPKIMFDSDQMTQVLTNYLNNAMKFTDQGSITIISEQVGENSIKVSVKDSGIGIKEEDFQKLFQSFSQISTGMGRQTGGTGLGLILCKKIVEHHKGKVGVESVYGNGATFYFFLPIHDRRVS